MSKEKAASMATQTLKKPLWEEKGTATASVAPAEKALIAAVAKPVNVVNPSVVSPQMDHVPIEEKPASERTMSDTTNAQSSTGAALQFVATKSMTVKIDAISYKKLKNHGTDIGKTSQDIFVQALAMYFKANKL
jgi:cytoskeletal protein RodZ